MGTNRLVMDYVKDFKVTALPAIGKPNSRYYVLSGASNAEEYITDKNGLFKKVETSSNYVHSQDIPSVTWNIIHNLGFKPNVTVVDSADTKVHGDIRYIDNNSLVASFVGAFAGKAYLS